MNTFTETLAANFNHALNLLLLAAIVGMLAATAGCGAPDTLPSDNEVAEILQDCDIYTAYVYRYAVNEDSLTALRPELHDDATIRECAAYVHLLSELKNDSSMVNRTMVSRHRAIHLVRNLGVSVRQGIDDRAIEESNLIMERYSVPVNNFEGVDILE